MKITIVGVGLIGGSLALKLKKIGLAKYVFGVDHSARHLEEAQQLQIIDEAATLEEAIKQSDLIIMAVPVDAAKNLIGAVLNLVGDNQTVMDVGSTKSEIVQAVQNHPKRHRFVAFHPMWGTENSGPAAAQADSFTGRVAVICNAKDSAEDALKLVETVAEQLQMPLVYMTAEDHDVHTAYISHISHITSYALANTVLEKEREEDKIFQLASSGFRPQ